ncbi:MAG: hypothetical protein OZSIB_3484 [Candidatus Ozemobacter sibiricus]|uniref:PPM-type phosphatase domain-containing protein n=1 Tax=Candidatus Ozemobacter sibiricus TaxID=2268124 RepID=A0A367ZSE7_9BACT|nr:MAG: hypothetical protein OZSIB_3484 [Candidatus Ozemobacter sibiricus]
MLVWQRSDPGTIREDNQDVLVIRDDQGVVLLVDGHGPAGRLVASEVAARLEPELVRLPLYGRPDDAPARLRRLLIETARQIEQDQVAGRLPAHSGVSLATAVVVEGQLIAARVGTAGLLAWSGGRVHRLEPLDLPRLADVLPDLEASRAPKTAPRAAASPAALDDRRFLGPHDDSDPTPEAEPGATQAGMAPLRNPELLGPLPLTVGDWVMVFSEGLLMSQPLAEVARVAGAVQAEPDDLAAALFARASQRYDGDDRTMALARFLPADLRRRFPPDTVIAVDLDRRLRMPLWQPLAVLGSVLVAAGTLLLLLWRKLR